MRPLVLLALALVAGCSAEPRSMVPKEPLPMVRLWEMSDYAENPYRQGEVIRLGRYSPGAWNSRSYRMACDNASNAYIWWTETGPPQASRLTVLAADGEQRRSLQITPSIWNACYGDGRWPGTWLVRGSSGEPLFCAVRTDDRRGQIRTCRIVSDVWKDAELRIEKEADYTVDLGPLGLWPGRTRFVDIMSLPDRPGDFVMAGRYNQHRWWALEAPLSHDPERWFAAFVEDGKAGPAVPITGSGYYFITVFGPGPGMAAAKGGTFTAVFRLSRPGPDEPDSYGVALRRQSRWAIEAWDREQLLSESERAADRESHFVLPLVGICGGDLWLADGQDCFRGELAQDGTPSVTWKARVRLTDKKALVLKVLNAGGRLVVIFEEEKEPNHLKYACFDGNRWTRPTTLAVESVPDGRIDCLGTVSQDGVIHLLWKGEDDMLRYTTLRPKPVK